MRQQAKCKLQSAKSTKLLLKIIQQRDKCIRICALCSMLFALFMLPALFGCATAKGKSTETVKPQEVTVINSIDVQDNKVTITASKPFVFTLYKPGDPYKVIIELPDVAIGAFTKKIVSNKAGITEIMPSQTESPALMAKLEMLLQAPASLDQDYRNNMLTITIKEDVTKKEETPMKVRATDIVKKDRESLLIKREETPASAQAEQKPLRETDTVKKEKSLLIKKEDAAASVAEQKSPLDTAPIKKEKSLTIKKSDDLTMPEQKSLRKATEITDVSFDASGDSVKVLIKGNGSMVPNVFPIDDRIVIDIPDVVMNTVLPSGVVSPVKGIRAGKHEEKIRLVLDLREKTNFDVSATGDTIAVILNKSGREPSVSTLAQMSGDKYERGLEYPERSKGLEAIERSLEKQENEFMAEGRCKSFLEGKENVNFDFQDQDIVPIFRLFADISGCNLFVHPDVRGKATMKFRDVPWNQALDTILKTFSLDKSVEGNIIRIAPNTIFAKESEEKIRAREALVKAEPLDTKIFPVSYAEVAIVEAAVRNSKILSPRGSISVDKRTSSMLIKDVASVFPEVENLLATLDRPTPQVLIEARIVEVNTNNEQELGIQWGLNLKASNTLAGIGGLSGVPFTSSGPFTGGNYLVDFPSKGVGPLGGSGITFGIINPARTMGLDIQLSAIASVGNLKVISNPKILTVDNGKAKILQGKSIPVRKLTTEGTISTEFKDVTLELNVTPHITPDGSIAMAVEIKKEELDPTVPSVEGVPGTDKKEANTNVIIKDGETIVIGGMYKITTNDSEQGVPGLMKIPVLGWLFKTNKTSTTTTELLIFVTPRIVGKP
ncbi:MAG: type IV pilus secretin PilQ [Nitrospira sp.]|nr:type IV pilus secretin PilQ [Nitrospira sp.]